MKTLQEAFETMAHHLLTQGRRCTSREPTGRVSCCYRNGDEACAVGALLRPLPDSYVTELEGKNETWPEFAEALVSVGVDAADDRMGELLNRMRVVHDDYEVSAWPKCMRTIADDLGLVLRDETLALLAGFTPKA
jgi:hypothetical protein